MFCSIFRRIKTAERNHQHVARALQRNLSHSTRIFQSPGPATASQDDSRPPSKFGSGWNVQRRDRAPLPSVSDQEPAQSRPEPAGHDAFHAGDRPPKRSDRRRSPPSSNENGHGPRIIFSGFGRRAEKIPGPREGLSLRTEEPGDSLSKPEDARSDNENWSQLRRVGASRGSRTDRVSDDRGTKTQSLDLGNGNFVSFYQSKSPSRSESMAMKPKKCHHCGQEGHVRRECPELREAVEKQAERYRGQDSRRGIRPFFGTVDVGGPNLTPESLESQKAEQGMSRYVGVKAAEKVNNTFETQTDVSESSKDGQDRASASVKSSRLVAEEDHSTASAREGRNDRKSRRVRDRGEGEEDSGASPKRSWRTQLAEDLADEDQEALQAQEARQRARLKKEREREKRERRAAKKPEPLPIYLPEYISVANLATALNMRYENFVAKLESLGYEDVQSDQIFDAENASLVASECNFTAVFGETGADKDLVALLEPEDKSIFPPRPPVVTIMGHVDHGKTTILDYFRKSSVVATEFGGITQHIGAFNVPFPSGRTITFLDTPGHAAFLSMRQRGANMTDIVVLVVAADDSVKPQTIEAIKHAQAARVPIIVAVSKMDKEGASPDKVKGDLARHGVEVEDYGGDTQVVCVSAKSGKGMNDLEEAISTQSEILDHRADVDNEVEGWIVEATTKSYGRVATVLVRRGTLKSGNILVAGRTWARVRVLRNEAGAPVDAVGPGLPVEVDGWREQPEAGDEVLQASDEQKAASVVEFRTEQRERKQLAKDMEAIGDARRQLSEKRAREAAEKEALAAGKADADADAAPPEQAHDGPIEVPFIIKADVSGSAEAVDDSVAAVGNSEIRTRTLRLGVGPVSEWDVEHAAAARGFVLAFNIPLDAKVSRLAAELGVRVIEHNIIYRLVDEVRELVAARLPPLTTQRVEGEADIMQVFQINVKKRQMVAIAGCRVRNGVVTKGSKTRVLRGAKVIYDGESILVFSLCARGHPLISSAGTLTSLKNVKKDVTEMRKGTECGIGLAEWEDFLEGDQIQCYEEKLEKRTL